MASAQATKRLTKEYQVIQKNPPPYIIAHPSDSNILEWHYIITGPADTPYENGQYWGTLQFPPDYPFAPPAIRMHTPSGRFQPSSRLCLSISDFHPKSFNPTWEVSTILIGLLSFMTSEEMTTGSIRATEDERRFLANQTRWWNSTGGGSHSISIARLSVTGNGAIRAGDGGSKFRNEWEEIDRENWKWITDNKIDPATGTQQREIQSPSCAPGADALRRTSRIGSTSAAGVVEGAQNARNAGQGWISRNKFWIVGGLLVLYVVVSRMIHEVHMLDKEL